MIQCQQSQGLQLSERRQSEYSRSLEVCRWKVKCLMPVPRIGDERLSNANCCSMNTQINSTVAYSITLFIKPCWSWELGICLDCRLVHIFCLSTSNQLPCQHYRVNQLVTKPYLGLFRSWLVQQIPKEPGWRWTAWRFWQEATWLG